MVYCGICNQQHKAVITSCLTRTVNPKYYIKPYSCTHILISVCSNFIYNHQRRPTVLQGGQYNPQTKFLAPIYMTIVSKLLQLLTIEVQYLRVVRSNWTCTCSHCQGLYLSNKTVYEHKTWCNLVSIWTTKHMYKSTVE